MKHYDLVMLAKHSFSDILVSKVAKKQIFMKILISKLRKQNIGNCEKNSKNFRFNGKSSIQNPWVAIKNFLR